MIVALTGPLVDAYHARTFRQQAWLWLVSEEIVEAVHETLHAFSWRMGWPLEPEGEIPF